MTHAYLRPFVRHAALTLSLSAALVAGSTTLSVSGDRISTRSAKGDHGFKRVAGFTSPRFRHRAHRITRDYDIEPRIILYSDDVPDQEDFSDSFLREKAVVQRQRSVAKILRVTKEQFVVGEDRAARREARMIANIDNIEFRFYRPNEAYDVRFPSVVYLDSLRK